MNVVTHVEADDGEHTLCGKMQTYYDAVTTRDDAANVDCLRCIMLLEGKEED